MNCFKCGKNEMLPFTCPYCKQQFCTEHRLPENHLCPSAPARAPLGSELTNKNPYSLTESRRRMRLEPPAANPDIPWKESTQQELKSEKNTSVSKHGKFLSEGNLHFVKNSSYKRQKHLKLAVGIIIGVIVGVMLIYSLPAILTTLQQSASGYTQVKVSAYDFFVNKDFGDYTYSFTYYPSSTTAGIESKGSIYICRQDILPSTQFPLILNIMHNYYGITFKISEVKPDYCILLAKSTVP